MHLRSCLGRSRQSQVDKKHNVVQIDFQALAGPSKGIIPVSWEIVSCGIKTPIMVKNKEGTSKFWFSMQVLNANVPVAKLEVSVDGGASWQDTMKRDYNFFENPSDFGDDSVDIKIMSINGDSIIVKSVGVAPSSTITAGNNLF